MPVSQQIVNDKSTETNRGGGNLLRHTSTVGIMTLVSRLLGFFRDVVLASLFGAGAGLDAFLIAFKIPNFFRRLFGEGAFSQAFVPVLAEYATTADHKDVQSFISRTFSSLLVSLVLLVILAEIAAPVLIYVFAPGFIHDPVRYGLALHMVRVTFPYILLISLVAMVAAVLNTYQSFALPALAPVLLNVALIAVSILWAPHSIVPAYALAWGVLLGGVAQLSLVLPAMCRLGLAPRWALCWRDRQVRRVLKLMIPALFGVSVAQVSLIIDNMFASYLPLGSISWLYYSDRLTYLPLGVIGVALATVVLPTLSRQFHRNPKEYGRTLTWAVQTALTVGVPASVALMVLAKPILATLFLHGHFRVVDVVMTSKALVAFALGLPAFMLIKILASAFYSMKNIKTPVKVAAVALVVNVLGNLALIVYLKHAGLALSTSIAAYVNASALTVLLWRQGKLVLSSQWFGFVCRLALSTAMMAVSLWCAVPSLSAWLSISLALRVLYLFALIALGMGAYFLSMRLCGWRWSQLKASGLE